ncbi:unnamed protein product [Lampetra fluviatilis]
MAQQEGPAKGAATSEAAEGPPAHSSGRPERTRGSRVDADPRTPRWEGVGDAQVRHSLSCCTLCSVSGRCDATRIASLRKRARRVFTERPQHEWTLAHSAEASRFSGPAPGERAGWRGADRLAPHVL